MGDGRWGKLCQTLKTAKPFILMVAMQLGAAGMYVFTMSTFTKGMSRYVYVVYRNAAASLTFAPFAFFLERKIRPKLTFSVFWRIMLLGFIEVILDQEFASLGMVYTSASYTTAILNATPSVTFVIAAILRIEHVRMKEVRSQAKVIGTVLSFGGALLMALYKGPILNLFGSSHGNSHHESTTSSSSHGWILGTLFLFVSCTAFACFYVFQSMVLKIYPAAMSLVSMVCFLGAIQALGVALVIDRNPHAWAVGWDSRLFAPLYAGVVATGLMYTVQGRVMRSRGPVFVTAFNPLLLLFAVILGTALLGEKLYLGSVIGSVILVMGLYAVVWGKSKDGIENKCTDGDETKDDTQVQQQLPVSMPPTALSTQTKAQLLQMESTDNPNHI